MLENEYEIVVHLFGAAFAAPNKGTTIVYRFRSLSTVLSSTENSRIQGLFKALSDFPVLFQGIFNFSRIFQESPLNSSTFQACANPGSVEQTRLFHLYDPGDLEN